MFCRAALTHLLLIISISCLTACGPDKQSKESTGQITLQVWFHSGQEGERQTIEAQVDRFNTSQKTIKVDLNFIPERDYNAQVQAAALAGDLPDLLEFDGPYVYNYVWQGHLIPLDALIPGALKKDLLPSIAAQGTYRGHLYSIGTFDSGLTLYGNREHLNATGMRIPTDPGAPWSISEFNTLLRKLSQNDDDGAVLDLKLNYAGEWYAYAFSPVIQSAGADLINRNTHQTSDGILNSENAVQALSQIQDWFKNNYVDSNIDDGAFVTGRVALSWVGHWEYSRYSKALNDKLIVLPLPDFGKGSRTGQGSWNWGITTNCKHPEAAMAFLEFLMQPDEILAMTNSNGAVPATKTAIEKSTLYGPEGPLRLFALQLLHGYSVPRPATPAYPVITSAFQQAFLDIRNGGDIKVALDRAVATIDQDIRDNKGYQTP